MLQMNYIQIKDETEQMQPFGGLVVRGGQGCVAGSADSGYSTRLDHWVCGS